MKKSFLLLLCFVSLSVTMFCKPIDYNYRQPNTNDSIERLIENINLSFDTIIFPTRIWISDSKTCYHPNHGVLINKNQLTKDIEQKGYKNIEFIVRLIIAHEKMHARQLYNLSQLGIRYENMTFEQKQIMECQADICAGYCAFFNDINRISEIFFHSILVNLRNGLHQNPSKDSNSFQPMPSDLSLANQMLSSNAEAIDWFFSIGDNSGISSTHPNSDFRRLAFEMGLLCFFNKSLSIVPQKMFSNIEAFEMKLLQHHAMMINQTLGIINSDINPQGLNFELWSERTARQIIHFPNEISKGIIIKRIDLSWNKTLDRPYCYYEFEISNTNSKEVFFDIAVLMKLANRNYPNNTLKNKIVTANRYAAKISPYGVYRIIDSILWIPGNDSLMPQCVLPGNYGSLYYFTNSSFAPNTDQNTSSEKEHELYRSSVEQLSPSQKFLKLFLRRNEIFNNPEIYKQGVGNLNKHTKNTTYNSFLFGNKVSLCFRNDKSLLNIASTICSFSTDTIALREFDKIKNDLKTLRPDLRIIDTDDNNNSESDSLINIYEGNKLIGWIECICSSNENQIEAVIF